VCDKRAAKVAASVPRVAPRLTSASSITRGLPHTAYKLSTFKLCDKRGLCVENTPISRHQTCRSAGRSARVIMC